MARIQVLDRNKRPVVNAKVFVKWSSGGTSERPTNSSGIADLETSGLAEYILVNNKDVSGSIRLDDNRIYEVSDGR